jgi:outer membrane receptor for ferrienterochelin and colicins
MKKILLLLALCINTAYAQHVFTAVVQDSITRETLPGVTVAINGTNLSGATNNRGIISLKDLPAGNQIITFTYIGYATATLTADVSQSGGKVYTVYLSPDEQTMEEVVISSTRTNSRIKDLPMKVEVLGQEEMEEENMLKPGNIASILGDLSVIHIQQTSATTGNTVIRMQGLDGRYTQLLRDGLPLFDGFSGNFGVLSIPPLDLKQVEIIKGSSSTLYGGGAIAGIINFISKAPATTRDLSFMVNRSTLNETNVNGYFSQRFGKFGLTMLAQQNTQSAYDVNKDGFADVPKFSTTIIHPRFFYYFNDREQLDAGYAFTYEDRRGGDMQVINKQPDADHSYLERNISYRHTADMHYANSFNSNNRLNVKGSITSYQLNNNFNGFNFRGHQTSSYAEVSDLIKTSKNDIVIGANYAGEYFRKKASDPSALTDYTYHTKGLFVQEGFHLTPKFLIEGGLRADHHNVFGWFVLPRIAFLYKPETDLSLRLSSGLGYKTPNIFIPENLTGNFGRLLPVTARAVNSERSRGVNFDAGYHIRLSEHATLDIDQALYYTYISSPIIPVINADNSVSLSNAPYHISSYGTDTYLRFTVHDVELYFGYNHTISKQAGTGNTVNLPFSPQDKFSTTIAYAIEGQWRFGIEASLEANQYVPPGRKVRNIPFAAAMIERKFGEKVSLVLNCENIGDFRQSNYEALYSGPRTSPVFSQLWAPIDGRVFNLALRLKL